MGSNDIQGTTPRMGRMRPMQRLVLTALALVAIAAAGWGVAVAATRGSIGPTSAVTAGKAGLVVARADDLPNADEQGQPFEVWTASDEESGAQTTLYVWTMANPYAESALSRLLLQPAQMSLGVSVDESAVIQRIQMLSPRTLTGAPASFRNLLDSWDGMSFFQVLTAAKGYEPAGAGAMARNVADALHDLAASTYLRDMGREAFTRFMAQVNAPGLRLDFPFPYFRATTWDGAEFTLNQLAGKKVLVVFTEPTCGSCYEASMTLLNTVVERGFDITPVVFIFGDTALAPVQRFAGEAPSNTVLISDPQEDLGRSIGQTSAPYAVILDEQHVVRYSGASGKGSPVYEYLEQLAGAR